MTAPLRVLLIGAGYFARFHAEAWHAMASTQLVAVADLDLGTARAIADAIGGEIATASDAADLIAQTEPDIVDIAAPPPAHMALIRAAFASPAPRAVICQKPFCANLDEARAAAALAATDGRPLVVHENFRFQPWYREIARLLGDGTLGQVYQITFRLRPGDGQGAEAYLARQPYFQTMPRFLVHETAVHWIDTFRFLLGDPATVYADLRRLNPAIAGEDAGLIVFGYADGRRAVFDGNRLSDHPAENTRLTMGECLVEAERGMLALDGFGRLWRRAPGEQSWAEHPTQYPRTGFGGECVSALQAHVAEHLTTGTPLENEARDYIRIREIEEAVYRSAAEGRVLTL